MRKRRNASTMMTVEHLLGELEAIRQAIAQRERALRELGFQGRVF